MYLITFVDDTFFKGGDLQNSKWNDMPDKEIKEIEYFFPRSGSLLMVGYQSYNHLIEKVYINSQEFINKIFLMGRDNNKIDIVTYDLKSSCIKQSIAEFGKEYEGRDSSGWKNGSKIEKPWLYLNSR